MASNADKKSNATQIAQSVLDVENQAIKVSIVGSDDPGGVGVDINLFQVAGATTTTNIGAAGNGTQRVVLATDQPTIPVDIQDTSIAVSLNKDEDSVTIYAPGGNTVPIPVSGSVSVSNQPSALAVVGAGAAAPALRVQLSDESLSALENISVTVTNSFVEITNDAGNPIPVNGTVSVNALPAGNNNIGDVDVASLPAPLNVTGSGAAASALRVQLADESLTALENISVTLSNASIEISNDVGNPVPVSGTVAATQSGTWNINNVSGTVSLPTGASTSDLQTTGNTSLATIATNTTTLSAEQNAATLGQRGVLIQGAVTTAAPAYTTAQTSPISLTTTGAVRVDGSATTQPVSGTVTANLGTIAGVATETTLSGLNTKVTTTANGIKVDGSAVTQPVSAIDLDIRNLTSTDVVTVTGGAGQTADVKVTLDGEQVSVSNFPAPLSVAGAGAAASALRVQLSDESLSALENINVSLSNSSIEISNDAGNPVPVSAASLPLPTGAATEAKQDVIVGHIDNVENTLNLINTDTLAIKTAVQLLDDTVNSDGAAINGTKLIMVGGFDGVNAQFLSTNANGHVNIADGGNSITVDGTITANLGTIAGVATETTLASIDGKTATLGQKTMSGSAPVVIASNQTAIPVTATDLDIRNLTTGDIVTVNGGTNQTDDIKITLDGEQVTIANFPTNQVVSGTVSINPIPAGDNNIGNVDIVSLPAPLNVTGAGAAASALRVHLSAESLAALEDINITMGSVTITNTGANPVPVSAASLPLPTGAATEAKQDTAITSLQLLDDVVATAGNAALSKGYQISGTDGTTARILATTSAGHVKVSDGGDSLTVDGTVTANQGGTWNIADITGSISLPTGAATETTLAAASAKLPATLGQKTSAASLAVTIASDQTAVPASQSGTWNINNISGTVSLPTGAATSAKQDTMIGHLDGVEGLLTTNNTDTASILTSVQLLDNVVTTHDASAPTASYQISGFASSTAPAAVASGDAARLWLTTSGAVNIADGGGSITVDGTITANLGTIAGVATETTLSSINGKLGTLGQKAMAGSAPVVISSDQSAIPVSQSGTWNIGSITTLPSIPAGNNNIGDVDIASLPAPLNVIGSGAAASALRVQLSDESLAALENITVDVGTVEISNDAGNPIPVNGTVTANIGTTGGLALNTTVDSLLKPASTLAAVTTLGSITNTVVVKADTLANQANALKVDGSAVTQPVSGSVSVSNFPATQAVSATNLDIRDLTATDVVTVTGGAGQTADVKVTLDGEQVAISNFPATQVVSGTVTANAGTGTFAVSAASLPLPAGAATETTLSAVSGKLPATLGQKTMANSLAVSIASDQSAIPASQSGTWNITNVSGTVSLPTGASTSAIQTNGTQRTQLTDGTNNVETAAAAPSSGARALVVRNIPSGIQSVSGTVDVSNFPAPLSVAGAGAAASALRVQLSDESIATFSNLTVTLSNNNVTVDNDGSNPIPVSQSGTWNIGSITGSLPSGSNNIGDVDVASLPGTVQADIGAIKTAVEAVNTKTTGPVALRFDNSTDPIAYKGEANAGTATSAASWRISRITTAGDGSVTIEWADGNTNFDNIWNNRTSLSYS